jgi:hypothetical protein
LQNIRKKAFNQAGEGQMKKKRIRESIIVEIRVRYISDDLFQKLGEEACRRGDINFQIPELPDISLRKVAAFSGKEMEELEEAKKYLLGIFFEEVLNEKPVRIIFKKTRRRRKREGNRRYSENLWKNRRGI